MVANDAFTDVPTTNVHHDDITWLADTGVTIGCNPPDNTEFCPGDNVTRQQMASFLRRLAENQVVDADTAITAENWETLDGRSVEAIMPVTASGDFGSITGLGTTVETAGEVTIEAPTAGRVMAYGNGTAIMFGDSTVAHLGVSETPTDLGASLQEGNLDGSSTDRRQHAMTPIASFPVDAGSHTLYLNAQKSTVFDAAQINMIELRMTLIFVPGG